MSIKDIPNLTLSEFRALSAGEFRALVLKN